MHEGRILLRSSAGPQVDQIYLERETGQLYGDLKRAWTELRPEFSTRQNHPAVIVDQALGLEKLPLKPAFHLQLPHRQDVPPPVRADFPWKIYFKVDPNSGVELIAYAPVLAVHETDKADSKTPRHKQIAEVAVTFNPLATLDSAQRSVVQQFELARRQIQQEPELPSVLYDATYRPLSWSLKLNYWPYSGDITGKKSPLVDRVVTPSPRAGVEYFFDGVPVDFGRRSSEIWLRACEYRDPANWPPEQFEDRIRYFPGVSVPK